MNELISIIIPVYNSEKWIKRCLESIINQSYSNLEIIIINDGSTDSSKDICSNYKKIDKRIKLINKENEGSSIARNLGVNVSKGKYIQFVDSDDFLDKNACKILYETIFNTKSDLVICGLNVIKDNKILRKPRLNKCIINIKEKFDNFQFIYPILASPCNKLYKRELFNHKFDSNYSLGEDLLNNLEYMKKCKYITIIEECLYNVVLDNSNSENRRFRDDKLDIVLSLKVNEEIFLKDIYKDNYDKNFIYKGIIKATHAFFREICEKKHRKYSLEKIDKYIKNNYITVASKNVNFKRLDYKIFNFLLKLKLKYLIYMFFIFKINIRNKKLGFSR